VTFPALFNFPFSLLHSFRRVIPILFFSAFNASSFSLGLTIINFLVPRHVFI